MKKTWTRKQGLTLQRWHNFQCHQLVNTRHILTQSHSNLLTLHRQHLCELYKHPYYHLPVYLDTRCVELLLHPPLCKWARMYPCILHRQNETKVTPTREDLSASQALAPKESHRTQYILTFNCYKKKGGEHTPANRKIQSRNDDNSLLPETTLLEKMNPANRGASIFSCPFAPSHGGVSQGGHSYTSKNNSRSRMQHFNLKKH